MAELAGVFADSGGDLRAVAGALVDLEAAWSPAARKLRTPQDWLVAVFRAVAAPEAPDPLPAFLRELRHTPWSPAAPAGYPDTRRAWADPDGLMNRAELARSLAPHLSRGGLDPTRLLEVVDIGGDDPLRALLHDVTLDADERVALALGGPAFQWR